MILFIKGHANMCPVKDSTNSKYLLRKFYFQLFEK